MRYQALALDLDGTLTNSRKEVTSATRAALGRAMFEGCKVILASGRPLVGIQPVAWALGLPRLGGYILAYNGGQVVDCRTGETLRQDRLDPAQIHRLCAFARQQGVSILTYDRDGIVTEHPEDPFVQKEAGINRIPVQKVPDLAAYVTYPITKMLLVGEPERMAAVDADGSLRGDRRTRGGGNDPANGDEAGSKRRCTCRACRTGGSGDVFDGGAAQRSAARYGRRGGISRAAL